MAITPEPVLREVATELAGLRVLMDERHERYQERADAQKENIAAALAAADRAVVKAELATEKRFEGVNEFRATLADQQRTLIPRAEVEVMVKAITEKINALTAQVSDLNAERRGIRGGWGYAVGVAGLVLTLFSLFMVLYRLAP